MNLLRGMEVFIAVAKHNGFSPAARNLNISTTAVSRYIQEFEDWCGAQLIRRTTRKISLTDIGETQLLKCQQIVDDVSSLVSINRDDDEPSGNLRLTAPVFVAKRLLAKILPEFLTAYPKIAVELLAVDRQVDLIGEGFDLALRIGHLQDSSLRARKLGETVLQLVASPDYLNRNGTPTSVRDLKNHNCIVDTIPRYGDRWPLSDESMKKGFRAKGNFRVNDGEIAESLVLEGAGIGFLPKFFVTQHIDEGRLVHLFDNLETTAIGIYLVYQSRKHLSLETRTLMDFLIEHSDINE